MDTKDYKQKRKELFDQLTAAKKDRNPFNTILVTRIKTVKKKGRYVLVETDVESTRAIEDLLSRIFLLDWQAKRESIGK